MQVSFNDKAVVFTDDKNKSTSFELVDEMADDVAVKALNRELSASVSASAGAVSLLSHILDNPRFDAYKGTCPWNEAPPAEFKQAVRMAEDEYIKGVFFAVHGNPEPLHGVKVGDLTEEQKASRLKYSKVSEMFDKYMTALRAGGSYANARSHVLAYFAKAGRRPIADNGKLFSVAALKKMLAVLAKENTPEPEQVGIAGKLVSLSSDLANRTEKTDIGDVHTAIAALKNMLATYEGLATALAEQATGSQHGGVSSDVSKMAQAAVRKAAAEPATI